MYHRIMKISFLSSIILLIFDCTMFTTSILGNNNSDLKCLNLIILIFSFNKVKYYSVN